LPLLLSALPSHCVLLPPPFNFPPLLPPKPSSQTLSPTQAISGFASVSARSAKKAQTALPKGGNGPKPAQGEDDYGEVLKLAYLFYEGQMSGKLPEWNRLLVGKPGGYKTSAHLNDGKEIGKDLAGGFYDAGGKHILVTVAAAAALRCFFLTVHGLHVVHGPTEYLKRPPAFAREPCIKSTAESESKDAQDYINELTSCYLLSSAPLSWTCLSPHDLSYSAPMHLPGRCQPCPVSVLTRPVALLRTPALLS
jgi:hypothetical protein